MSGSDDRTKLMPTPAGASGAADDRTRAMPKAGADNPAQKQTAPDTQEPTAPDTQEPTAPDTQEPTAPDTQEPTAPDTQEPTAPDTQEPTAPDTQEPIPESSSSTDDSTRALPAGDLASRSASDDSTRLLGTSAPDDSTAVIGTLGEDTRSDDPTMALATGAFAAGGAAGADTLDDDVTIVRPQAQRRPRLLVQSPAGETEEHALESGEASIGRASSCTVVLANPEVSRKHARIVTSAGGSVLHVEGARRNTTVNGEFIEGERPLKHGDIVELASARLVFAETADTPSFDAEQPAAEAPRSLTVPLVAAVAVTALALGTYLLIVGSPPPPVAPAAPVAVAVAPPVVDTSAQAEAAAEAAREAAASAVREIAEREATAARAASREERIGKLLYEGDIALLEDRLTTPPNGSAVYAYSEVLKIDPENVEAKTKIAGIIEKYLGWAESAGSRAKARLYADKAAYIRTQVPSAGDGPALDARISALGGSAE